MCIYLQAIVDGDPPDLPSSGYSDAARDFVRSCLHKIPKLRPTYAMLVRHPWLAPLLKPPTISEEDEEENTPTDSTIPTISTEDTSAADFFPDPTLSDVTGIGAGANANVTTADKEVATWALDAMERRRLGKMGGSAKPALHQVKLDTVPSPGLERGGIVKGVM